METDIEILKILENDARIDVKEIAAMLDMNESDVKRRIKDLEKRGVIRKFKTSIDWKKVGIRHVTAIIRVKVIPQESAGFSKVSIDISNDPKVKDAFVATGEYDLVLLVEGRDIDEISEFITEKLAPKKEVVGTYTHIVLSEYKRDGVISHDEDTKRLKVSL
ncbi:MAG TPA: Lrp/AsnC family transcriptional regulator [Candidatus Altiarchaeales archaeon]|nr:Lrp/AsnC family transcriptional regulator [Candidatus Altiarchaeales archaeon]